MVKKSNKHFRGIIATILVTCLLFISSTLQTVAETKTKNQDGPIKGDYDQKINFLMKLCRVPGLSICVVRNDSILLSKGYGLYDIKNNKKATNETIYPAASITKTVTATAIMQLYEKGYFNLDDNVSEYLPFDLKNPKYPNINITFRMLLAHQSSLGDTLDLTLYFVVGHYPHEWLKEYVVPGGNIYNPKIWNNYAPGENVFYSSVGIEILGYIVERLSGQTYSDYVEEHILQPLDMKNSGFNLKEFDYNKIATPYIVLFGKYIPIPHIDSGSGGCAHGGLYTTVLDLSHYLLAYMNGGVYNGTRILKNETIELINTLQYPDSYDTGIFRYGLGWYFWNNSQGFYCGGHGGRTLGGGTQMTIRFSDNVGIIYFWDQFKYVRMYLGFKLPFERLFNNEIEKTLFDMADELK